MDSKHRHELIELSRQVGIRDPEKQTNYQLIGGLKEFLKHSDTLTNQSGGYMSKGALLLLSLGADQIPLVLAAKDPDFIPRKLNYGSVGERLNSSMLQEALDNLPNFWNSRAEQIIGYKIDKSRDKLASLKDNFEIYEDRLNKWVNFKEIGEQLVRQELLALRRQLEQRPQEFDHHANAGMDRERRRRGVLAPVTRGVLAPVPHGVSESKPIKRGRDQDSSSTHDPLDSPPKLNPPPPKRKPF